MTTRLRLLKPEMIVPGVAMMVETRVKQKVDSARIRSPVEICRVRWDQELPDQLDYGKQTLIPVDFLYCDM